MKYFDNAATTKISKESLEAYNKASEIYFNPSSLYKEAIKAKGLIENSREFFLKYFKCPTKSTFLFLGSATEANNSVLNSSITRKDKKYIFSAGEHSSIYASAKHYQELGYNVVFIPLKTNGEIDEDKLFSEIDETVALVSIIYVSNETGAVNDINKISKKIKEINKNTLIHTDAVQALGKIKIDLTSLDVDYLTVSAHKINGPKGVGALYIKNPNKFKPLIFGGGQEMNLRAGTENTAAIFAFKTALENLKYHDFTGYKKAFIDNLTGDFKLISNENCVPNIISLCFKGVRGETIEHMLEDDGYLIGTGSACNSKAGLNRVLQPIVDKKYIEGAIRISFSNDVEIEDCKQLAILISKHVNDYIKRVRR